MVDDGKLIYTLFQMTQMMSSASGRCYLAESELDVVCNFY